MLNNKENCNMTENADEVWKNIINKLAAGRIELPTTPITKKAPLWFSATTDNEHIFVSSAKDHQPSSKITMERKLTQKNFRKVYPLYLRRINGESVSAEATAATVNQVYYYSLIKHLGT